MFGWRKKAAPALELHTLHRFLYEITEGEVDEEDDQGGRGSNEAKTEGGDGVPYKDPRRLSPLPGAKKVPQPAHRGVSLDRAPTSQSRPGRSSLDSASPEPISRDSDSDTSMDSHDYVDDVESGSAGSFGIETVGAHRNARPSPPPPSPPGPWSRRPASSPKEQSPVKRGAHSKELASGNEVSAASASSSFETAVAAAAAAGARLRRPTPPSTDKSVRRRSPAPRSPSRHSTPVGSTVGTVTGIEVVEERETPAHLVRGDEPTPPPPPPPRRTFLLPPPPPRWWWTADARLQSGVPVWLAVVATFWYYALHALWMLRLKWPSDLARNSNDHGINQPEPWPLPSTKALAQAGVVGWVLALGCVSLHAGALLSLYFATCTAVNFSSGNKSKGSSTSNSSNSSGSKSLLKDFNSVDNVMSRSSSGSSITATGCDLKFKAQELSASAPDGDRPPYQVGFAHEVLGLSLRDSDLPGGLPSVASYRALPSTPSSAAAGTSTNGGNRRDQHSTSFSSRSSSNSRGSNVDVLDAPRVGDLVVSINGECLATAPDPGERARTLLTLVGRPVIMEFRPPSPWAAMAAAAVALLSTLESTRAADIAHCHRLAALAVAGAAESSEVLRSVQKWSGRSLAMSLLADVTVVAFAPLGRMWACLGAAFCGTCLSAAHAAVIAGARRRNARIHAYASVCAEAASEIYSPNDDVECSTGNESSSRGGSSGGIGHHQKGHLNESSLLGDSRVRSSHRSSHSSSSNSSSASSSTSSSAPSSSPATPERKLSSSSSQAQLATEVMPPSHAIQVVAASVQAGQASGILSILLSALLASTDLSTCHTSDDGRIGATAARFLYLLFGPSVVVAAAEVCMARLHPRVSDATEFNESSNSSSSTSAGSPGSPGSDCKHCSNGKTRRRSSLRLFVLECSRAVAYAVAVAAAGWLLLYGENANEDGVSSSGSGSHSKCGGSGTDWWTVADGGSAGVDSLAGQRRLLWALALMVALNCAARCAAAAASALAVACGNGDDGSSDFDHPATSIVDVLRCSARPWR